MNFFDTSIIIDMIKENRYRAGIISPITLLEVLRGIDEKKRPMVKRLLEASFPVANLNNPAIETYCSLYQKLKEEGTSLPDADLLVAATAIANDLVLETSDRHFQRLTLLGLRLK